MAPRVCTTLFLVKGWYAGVTLENCSHLMTIGIISVLTHVLSSEVFKQVHISNLQLFIF